MNRTYKVWIIGRRCSTEREIVANGRDMALMKAANFYGVKSFKCDAKWIKPVRVVTCPQCLEQFKIV